MKKTLLILAALLCCCFALKAQETQEFTSGGLKYRVTGTNPPTVELRDFTEGFIAHDLVIPSNVTYESTTYSVTSIGAWAFYPCSDLTGSLTIPNSVTSIGEYAFYRCSGFNGNLIIPNSVESIGNSAFEGCSGFNSTLTISNSVTSIGDSAFEGCSGFNGTLTIGNSVGSIGDSAFEGCSGFNGPLTIPNSVTSIGNSAFEGCSGFTGNLIIPNSVESIGNSAFEGCSGFNGELIIGTSVVSIGDYAFHSSTFTNIVAKPGMPPALGTDAFYGISELQSIFVPCDSEVFYDDEDESGWSEFSDKTEENFVMYDRIVTSSNPDFGTVSIIKYFDCVNSQSTVTATPAPYCMFRNWTENGVVVSTANPYTFTQESDRNLVANFTECTYVYEPIMSIPSSIDPDAVYVLGYQDGGDYYLHTSGTEAGQMQLSKNPGNPILYSFRSMPFGPPVTILSVLNKDNFFAINSDGVFLSPSIQPYENPSQYYISIQDGNISSLSVPAYTAYHDGDIIRSHANSSEGNLRLFKATIKPLYHIAVSASPEGAGTATATMGGVPVQSAAEGTEITITATPNEGYKFVNWTEHDIQVYTSNPRTFTLTSDRNLVANFFKQYDFSAICPTGQTLYYRIIDEEQNFVSLVAPNGDNARAWEGFTKPTGQIDLPGTVEHDGTSYTVKAIGESAFYNCNGLTGSLSIPNSVTSIGKNAFDCSGFTGSLTIGNSVTSIGDYAFYKCSGFTGSLTIPNSVTSIGNHAFRECYRFNGTLTIGNSVTSIGNYAFADCLGFTGSLVIPDFVESIGIWAFEECIGFTGSLTIGNAVTSIGNHAFAGCSGFTGSLTIGRFVTSIGENPFVECGNFTNIISKVQTVPPLDSKIPNASNNVYIPAGTTNSYKDAWDEYGYNFIEYGYEDYHFNGTGNEWDTATNWEENELPAQDCPIVFINADCQVNTNVEVGAVTIAAGKTLTVNEGCTLKADGVTLENGAQLVNNGTVSSSNLTVKKDIAGYGEGTGDWYLVSSPVGKIGIPSSMRANPIDTDDYDLYRFNQAGDDDGNEWINAKVEESQHINLYLDALSGYLYANKNNRTIVFHGGFATTETKELEYVEDVDFPGFNLVGNPYPCNTRIGRSFYRMNTAGTELIADVADAEIAPCEGVFVQAQGTGESVTFTPSATPATRSLPAANVTFTLSQGRSAAAIDRAIVRLGEGDVLGKMMLNADGTRLYIPQNGKDYAVVSTDASRGEMPLNFKAAKDGSYTITVNVENADLNYLHLVDNLTGNDVDLMGDGTGTGRDVPWRVSTYTFDAKTSDYASRFKLVFGVNGDAASAGSTGDFAYISNGEIIVSNEGRATLQVIDVMGRIVSSEEINGECRISTNGMTAGVYVLNLNGMTQKIVVK